jgi:hypothetical protein
MEDPELHGMVICSGSAVGRPVGGALHTPPLIQQFVGTGG